MVSSDSCNVNGRWSIKEPDLGHVNGHDSTLEGVTVVHTLRILDATHDCNHKGVPGIHTSSTLSAAYDGTHEGVTVGNT